MDVKYRPAGFFPTFYMPEICIFTDPNLKLLPLNQYKNITLKKLVILRITQKLHLSMLQKRCKFYVTNNSHEFAQSFIAYLHETISS